MLGWLYIALLVVGLAGFVLHLVAQLRVAGILRKRYPQQWNIVAADGRHHRLMTYAHLQRVLRSSIPEMFADAQLNHWHRLWRIGPWIAWPCLAGAIVLHVYAAR
ncbi:MAG TPA: hypothetical protein VF271_06035 [Rhodanobacteraceae bacterium]